MSTFLRHSKGAISLDHVVGLSRAPEFGVWYAHIQDGQQLEISASDADSAIVSLLPADGWELLGINFDCKGRPSSWYAEPIIAFAITLFGDIRPVTALKLIPEIHRRYALRRKGDPAVYVTFRDVCEDVDSWLEGEQLCFDVECSELAMTPAAGVA